MPRKTYPASESSHMVEVASMRPRPDAAENALDGGRPPATAIGFNEAAARCRGKPFVRRRQPGMHPASMRPRPDAAENVRPIVPALPRARASMRPRPDAAENAQVFHDPRPGKIAASMRPRPDAAENACAAGRARAGRYASMRPRPDAAENVRAAAAKTGIPEASMRPRPDAAENRRGRGSGRPTGGRFNEAAARCRGKRVSVSAWRRDPAASMRPRPDAAENIVASNLADPPPPPRASMRPRPDAAENWRHRPAGAGRRRCFNEAAARCRGKPVRWLHGVSQGDVLQ